MEGLEILAWEGEGYNRTMHFEEWRVALANFGENFDRNRYTYLERHLETDEVFVLLSGAASLVIGLKRAETPLETGKLYNVKKVEVLEPDCIQRELMLIKVKNDAAHRAEVFSAVDVYRAKVIDYTADEMCVEITGDPSKIDAFIKLMMTYDIIIELCRTGIVALERGSNTLFNK